MMESEADKGKGDGRRAGVRERREEGETIAPLLSLTLKIHDACEGYFRALAQRQPRSGRDTPAVSFLFLPSPEIKSEEKEARKQEKRRGRGKEKVETGGKKRKKKF